jgi:hypothetical protein
VTALVMPGVSPAYVHWGNWIARCSHRDVCDGAAGGSVLPLFGAGFICRSCGRATDVVWPSADMVESIGRLLMLRPHYKNRNWLPGETLHDLLEENAVHGVLPLRELSPKTTVMHIEGDRIIADALPEAPSRPELMR